MHEKMCFNNSDKIFILNIMLKSVQEAENFYNDFSTASIIINMK